MVRIAPSIVNKSPSRIYLSAPSAVGQFRLKTKDRYLGVFTLGVFTLDPRADWVRCDGYGSGQGEAERARACKGYVRPGDDYLVVAGDSGETAWYRLCSECAVGSLGEVGKAGRARPSPTGRQ